MKRLLRCRGRTKIECDVFCEEKGKEGSLQKIMSLKIYNYNPKILQNKLYFFDIVSFETVS